MVLEVEAEVEMGMIKVETAVEVKEMTQFEVETMR